MTAYRVQGYKRLLHVNCSWAELDTIAFKWAVQINCHYYGT